MMEKGCTSSVVYCYCACIQPWGAGGCPAGVPIRPAKDMTFSFHINAKKLTGLKQINFLIYVFCNTRKHVQQREKNTSCFFDLLWLLQQKSRQIVPGFSKNLCTIESFSSRIFLKQNFTQISFSVVPHPGKFVNSSKFDVIVTSSGLMEWKTLFLGTKIVIQSRKMLRLS